MLAIAHSSLGSLGGGLPVDVKALQQALKELAVAANYPPSDPGIVVSGIVDVKTVQALGPWASRIPNLPSAANTALDLASRGWAYLTETQRTSVLSAFKEYAKELTAGVRALIARYQPSSAAPATAATTRTSTPSVAVPQKPAATAAITPDAAPASAYKAGSLARFNVTRSVWSVYSPLAGAQGLGVATMGRCLFGDCLGEGEVDPPVPPGFVKAGEEPAPPAGVPQAGSERDKKPFYKNPYFWLGGVAVVGTGTAIVIGRRRRKAA